MSHVPYTAFHTVSQDIAIILGCRARRHVCAFLWVCYKILKFLALSCVPYVDHTEMGAYRGRCVCFISETTEEVSVKFGTVRID